MKVDLTGTGYKHYTFTALVDVPDDIAKQGEDAIRAYIKENNIKPDWEDYDPCDEDKDILPTEIDELEVREGWDDEPGYTAYDEDDEAEIEAERARYNKDDFGTNNFGNCGFSDMAALFHL